LAKRDYYEVLQVPKGADEATLKSAYRKLVRELHPDANPDDPKAEEKFKEVKEAYDVLTDPQKKALYDRYGMAAFQNQASAASSSTGGQAWAGGSPFEDLFETFMGGTRASTAQRHSMPQRGADLLLNLELTFEESFTGVRKEVNVMRNEHCVACGGSGAAAGTKPVTCTTCNGSGVVRMVRQTMFGNIGTQSTCETCRGAGQTIASPCKECSGRGRVSVTSKVTLPLPGGVEDGVRLRMPGEGDPGERGGPAGDLYIQVRVYPHKVFRRDRNDLITELAISFTQAVLGAEIAMETLEGKLTIRIPEGIESGTVLRQRDRGFPSPTGVGRGDLRVVVRVTTPKRLTDIQKTALVAFAEAMGEDDSSGTGKGLFERIREAVRGE